MNPVFGGFPTCRVLDPVGTESGNGMSGGDTAEFWLYRGRLQSEFRLFSGVRPNDTLPGS